MKRRKIIKIILVISFLPYVYVLLKALYYAVQGYDVYTWIKPVYTGTIYGMEAFKEVLLWDVMLLTIIPVLPVCLLYQITILVIHIIRKKKEKRME